MRNQTFYNNRVLDQFIKSTTRVTLKQLTVFGRNLNESKILRSANYVRTVQNLPFIVGTNQHIEHAYNLYWQAFNAFREFPPVTSLDQNETFCELTKEMLRKHLSVIPSLAIGIAETARYLKAHELHKFMQDMLQSRIGRRVIAEQHISLTDSFRRGKGDDGFIGIVNTKCVASDILQRAVENVRIQFRTVYGREMPEVYVNGDVGSVFTYIPGHVEYILTEILKNSAFAFADNNCSLRNGTSAPIAVTIADCTEDEFLVFRISDQSGGINKEVLSTLWSFSHLGTERYLDNFRRSPELAAQIQDSVPPQTRLGFGLPMSRAYADYWGGSLSIYSMAGYGTDAYLHISTGNRLEKAQ